jgi:hypothetical protein
MPAPHRRVTQVEAPELLAHLRKTQFAVIDLTDFPQPFIDDVNAQLGTLRKQDLDRINRVGCQPCRAS